MDGGFDGEPHAGRIELRIALIVGAGDVGMDRAGMDVDRHGKGLGGREDWTEFRAVEEPALRQAKDHRAFKIIVADAALKFARGGIGIGRRQQREAGELVGAAVDLVVQPGVGELRKAYGFGRLRFCTGQGAWETTWKSMPAAAISSRRMPPKSAMRRASSGSSGRSTRAFGRSSSIQKCSSMAMTRVPFSIVVTRLSYR